MDTKSKLEGIQLDLSEELYEYLQTQGFTGNTKAQVVLAGQAGSGRTYYRLKWKGQSRIIQQSHSQDADFERFVRYGHLFVDLKLPTPSIDAFSPNAYQVLMEDLGAETMLDRVRNGLDVVTEYKPIIDQLINWQASSEQAFAADVEFEERQFGHHTLRWETSYFLEHCWQGQLKRQLSPTIDQWFEELAQRVAAHAQGLMHRDFQSQNIMVHEGRVRFIDFQGARKGSIYYDLASLLCDPYVSLNIPQIQELLEYWIQQSPQGSATPLNEHWNRLMDAACQRLMQALGAFCNLSRNKGMSFFTQQIPHGLCQFYRILNAIPSTCKGLDEIKQGVGEAV